MSEDIKAVPAPSTTLDPAPAEASVHLTGNGNGGTPHGQRSTVTWLAGGDLTSQRVHFTLDGSEHSAGLAGGLERVSCEVSADDAPDGQTEVTARLRVSRTEAPHAQARTVNAIPVPSIIASPVTLPPSVQVTAPAANVTLGVGAQLTIQWTSSDATNQRVQFVDSATFEVIPIITGLDGAARSYTWIIPQDFVAAGQQRSGRIRVIARNANSGQEAVDDSDGIVTIRGASTALAVQVTQPAANVTLDVGASLPIQWTSSGATNQRVQFIDAANGTVVPIITGLDGNARSYTWIVPTDFVAAAQQRSGRIRVVARNANTGQEVFDDSDGLVTLRGAAPALTVQVTAPATNVTLDVGASLQIQWTSSGATNQRVQFIDAANGTVVPIITGLDGNARSYTWIIPTDFVAAGQQRSGRIRVVARNANTGQEVFDDSDGLVTVRGAAPALTVQVTAPAANITLDVGGSLPIQWTSGGATNQRVQFIDAANGAVVPIITGLDGNARSYTWIIPTDFVAAGQQRSGRIRVVARNANTGQEVFDDSDGLVTVRGASPALTVMVTAPATNVTLDVGASLPIQWTSSGATNQRVQFIDAVNGTVVPIITGLDGNARSYTWIVPTDFVAAGQQRSGRIRVVARNANTGQEVFDDSDGLVTVRGASPALTVQVTAPAANITLDVGSSLVIQWTSGGATNQRVQFIDAANGTVVPIITGLDGNARSYTWIVPTDFVAAGQQRSGRIRVVARNANTGQEVFDDSDGLVTVRGASPALMVQVTAPATNVTLDVGGSLLIQWTSGGATNQRVQFVDSATGEIVPVITGLDGSVRSYTWMIPLDFVAAGQQRSGRIRVVARNANTGQEVFDDSDGIVIIRGKLGLQLSPESGPVGIDVSLSGAGVAGATAVLFNGIPSPDFFVEADGSLVAEVPDGATSGAVSVVTAGGTLSGGVFTVTAAVKAPTIGSFMPTSADPGMEITVTGTNFVAGSTKVLFRGRDRRIRVPATVDTPTQLRASVPQGAVSGPLIVKTPNGKSAPSTQQLVIGGAIIAGFTPTQGYAEQSVTIVGRRFTGATMVKFGDKPAGFRVPDDTQIVTGVPIFRTTEQGPLDVRISITTAAGTVISDMPFKVTPLPPPMIEKIEPDSGPEGSQPVITGTNLIQIGDAPSTVTFFDGIPSDLLQFMGTTGIKTQVPVAARTGPVTVTTPGGTATINFTVTPLPAPEIDGFAPASGNVGTRVKITGRNFTGLSGGEGVKRGVFFAGADGGEVRALVLPNSTKTEIQVDVPQGAVTGPITVFAAGGTVATKDPFQVATGLFLREATADELGKAVGCGELPCGQRVFAGTSCCRVLYAVREDGKKTDTCEITATASFVLDGVLVGPDVIELSANPNPVAVSCSDGRCDGAFAFTVRIKDTAPPATYRIEVKGKSKEDQKEYRPFVFNLVVAPPQQGLSVSVSVRNRVLPSDCLAIKGCEVALRQGTSVRARGRTDTNGMATLSGPPLQNGIYDLVCTATDVDDMPVGFDTAKNKPDVERIWRTFRAKAEVNANQIVRVDSPDAQVSGSSLTVKLQPVWMRSPNRKPRQGVVPNLIVVHRTGFPTENSLNNFLCGGPLSIHYLVDTDGQVIKLVQEEEQAFHAGKSSWKGVSGANAYSVGIEQVNLKMQEYPRRQAAATADLAAALQKRLGIKPEEVVGHSDVAPSRKPQDPGLEFPWERLEELGLSLKVRREVDESRIYGGLFIKFNGIRLVQKDSDALQRYGGMVRADFKYPVIRELQEDLRSIGYGCPVSGEYDAATAFAVQAFQDHPFSFNSRNLIRERQAFDDQTARKLKQIRPDAPGHTGPDPLEEELPEPSLAAVAPAAGEFGAAVLVSGAGFTDADGESLVQSVQFGGVDASFQVTDSGALLATVPAGAATGAVTVTTAGGTAASTGVFTATAPAVAVALAAEPDARTIVQGQTAGFTIRLDRRAFAGEVALAVTGLPAGATAEIAPNPVAEGSATLSVFTTAGQTTLGTRTLTIMGSAVGAPEVVISPATATLSVGLAPSVAGFSPAIGSPGSNVEITGANLDGATEVRFNGVAASFLAGASSQLLATVPPGATSGPISVNTRFGTAQSAQSFTITTEQPPVITGFTPQSGAPGAMVQITGSGFADVAIVDFGGAVADFTVVSRELILAMVPATAITGRIRVSTAAGTVISDGIFVVTLPPSVTLSATPASRTVVAGQAAAYSIAIGRTSFTGAVDLAVAGFPAGATASFSPDPTTGTSSTLTVTTSAATPAGARTLTISGTAPGAPVSSAAVELVVGAAAPVVASFTPSSGAAGTLVTITGANLSDATSVRFNGVSAAFTVASATTLQATVPQGASTGPISVTTPAGTVASTAAFTVPPPAGVVLSATPAAATVMAGQAARYTIGIARTSFAGPVDLVVSNLPAGTSAAFSADPTTGTSSVLTVSTSAATPAGTSRLAVSATAAGVSITPINVDLAVAAPAPAITGFSPVSGPVGTAVSVTGANFTGATQVSFNGVLAQFQVTSPGSLTATVPPGAVTGPLSIVTPAGSATSAGVFTVTLKSKDTKEKELKERKELKEKELKEKEEKELKEDKELKEKETEGKTLVKDRKDNKDSLELGFVGEAVQPYAAPAGDLRHFIAPELRPDLERSALNGEEDLAK